VCKVGSTLDPLQHLLDLNKTLLTSDASDGGASADDASPSDGDANPNGDGGASPSDGHVPTAPLEAGAVRPPHPLSRPDAHSDSLYFQLAAEQAPERLAQSRQARSHRRQIQQRLSETVGVPWRPSYVVYRMMRKEFRRRDLNCG
jgi:hypothetical protein